MLFTQESHIQEYRLYFSATDRKPVQLDILSLSETWTEQSLAQRFPGYPIHCNNFTGLPNVQRACAVDVNGFNGMSALYMTFFFGKNQLREVAINMPWWTHRKAGRYLREQFGQPYASQLLPRGGVRLHGWRFSDESAIFFPRDMPWNPFSWTGIHWRSRSACLASSCFTDH